VPNKLASLATLGEAFGIDISKPTAKIYLKAMDPYSDAAVEKAVEMCILHEERFPAFATIKKYLDEDRIIDLTEDASLQARFVLREIEIGGSGVFVDPITARVMSVYIPYADVRHKDYSELGWFAHKFVEQYLKISKSKTEMAKAINAFDGKLGDKKAEKSQHEKESEVVLASKNKYWLMEQEHRNNHTFSRTPDEKSFWPHRFAVPIKLDDADFEAKFRKATEDPRFKTYVSADWKFDGDAVTKPEIPQMTMEEWANKVRSVLAANKKSPSPYAGMDLPQIQAKQRLENSNLGTKDTPRIDSGRKVG